MRQRCLNLLLASSLLFFMPRAVNEAMPSIYPQTAILNTHIGQSPPVDPLWLKWVKDNSTLLTFIVAILVFVLGVKNLPELKTLLRSWNEQRFRRYLSNSFKNLDMDPDPSYLQHEFKERLKTILGDDLFDNCLKDSFFKLKQGQCQNNDLPETFRASIQKALTDEEKEIFYSLLNEFLYFLLSQDNPKGQKEALNLNHAKTDINTYLGKYLKTSDNITDFIKYLNKEDFMREFKNNLKEDKFTNDYLSTYLERYFKTDEFYKVLIGWLGTVIETRIEIKIEEKVENIKIQMMPKIDEQIREVLNEQIENKV